ncbi:MAG: sulfite exporter TauE/SafE family protein [Bacteroidia bacterium]|nr:sulfite exporter TauE/SafE family protein [Bacteroidia bacterium]MDW8346161.1 sulfite exporter TauE/SafE family protein [Bacteroidia bacterium]
MEYFLIAVVAFLASTVTFFSGFGLNTLLMPVFALFFSLEVAIALTAIVHILNNTLKLGIIGKYTYWKVVLYFGTPALIASFIGAQVLVLLSQSTYLIKYTLAHKTFYITWIKLTTGFLVLFFTMMESIPKLKKIGAPLQWMPLGGVLSGFFGGLSGHQGALRSVFLIRMNLDKHRYIATGATIAFVIDIARLVVYGMNTLSYNLISKHFFVLLIAVSSAFLGVIVGSSFLKKVTYQVIQRLVTVFLIVFSLCLILGIL